MKKKILINVLLLVTGGLSFWGCAPEINDPKDNHNITLYTNSTGNPSADALQMVIENTTKNFTVKVYGTFDANGDPDEPKSLTFQKNGNDTTFYFILEPATYRISSFFFDINGVKQPYITEFEYLSADGTNITTSIYNYNWSNNTAELIFQMNIHNPGSGANSTLYYTKSTGGDIVLSLLGGVAVIETAIAAGVISLPSLSAAATATVAAAIGPFWVGVGVVGLIFYSLESIAEEPVQYETNSTGPQPDNPTAGTNNPENNFPPNLCNYTGRDCNVWMGGDGAILVNNATGGTPPYEYALGNQPGGLTFQSIGIFGGFHPTGTYTVYVRDAEGCIYAETNYLDPSLAPIWDIDSNMYNVVAIGSQIWMTENLNTTRYNDGTPIAYVTDNTAWGNSTTGAYTYYNNNPSYENTYGKLYNWYTVTNPSNLCPAGWHVPSKSEWDELLYHLDANPDTLLNQNIAGGKMKTTGTDFWIGPNVDATNETGFSGLPGGTREGEFGGFSMIGMNGWWWSSSTYALNTSEAHVRILSNNTGTMGVGMSDKNAGCSVRCIKD